MENTYYYDPFKIIIQGAVKTYKSFIVKTHILNNKDKLSKNQYTPTCKVNKISTAIVVDPSHDNTNIKYQDVEIYDCMGTNYYENGASEDFINEAIESFNKSLSLVCKNIDLTLIFFDINNKNSFEEMKYYYDYRISQSIIIGMNMTDKNSEKYYLPFIQNKVFIEINESNLNEDYLIKHIRKIILHNENYMKRKVKCEIDNLYETFIKCGGGDMDYDLYCQNLKKYLNMTKEDLQDEFNEKESNNNLKFLTADEIILLQVLGMLNPDNSMKFYKKTCDICSNKDRIYKLNICLHNYCHICLSRLIYEKYNYRKVIDYKLNKPRCVIKNCNSEISVEDARKVVKFSDDLKNDQINSFCSICYSKCQGGKMINFHCCNKDACIKCLQVKYKSELKNFKNSKNKYFSCIFCYKEIYFEYILFIYGEHYFDIYVKDYI